MKRFLVQTADLRAQILSAETIHEAGEHMRAMRDAAQGTPQAFLLLSITELADAPLTTTPPIAA